MAADPQQQVTFHNDEGSNFGVKVETPAGTTNGNADSKPQVQADRWIGKDGKRLQPYQVLTQKEKRAILVSITISMFLAAVDQNIVVVALPKITEDLQGFNYLAWVISAYMLTASSTMALYGRFSDVYGRRLVYLFAVGIFCVGSTICGAAQSIWTLIGGRAIQGLGGGGLMSLAMIIIGDIIEPVDRPKYMSGMSSIFGIASIVAPLLGGVFTDQVTWRWVFYINLPLGVLAFVSSLFAMARFQLPHSNLSLDVVGSLLIASATACIVLFVTWGGADYAWDSWVIIFLMLLSLALLVLFVLQELRHKLPILNLMLFKQWNFAVIMFMMFFSGVTMLGAFAYLPVYYINGRGDSAVMAGLKLIPFVFGFMTAAGVVGGYMSKTGKYHGLLPAGTAIYALGIGLLILLGWDTNFGLIFLYLVIGGIGLGIIFPISTILVQNSVPVADMANALSAYTFFQSMGGAIGVAILGSILTSQLAKELIPPAGGALTIELTQQAYVTALHSVFGGAVAPAIVAFLFALLIKNVPLFNLTAMHGEAAAAMAAIDNGASAGNGTDKHGAKEGALNLPPSSSGNVAIELAVPAVPATNGTNGTNGAAH